MAVDRARAGDPAPLVALAERGARWSIDTMAFGQTMSILCSEDVGRHRAPQTTPTTLIAATAVDFWHESCAVWPKGPPLDINEHTVLAVPALILSGALDPVTPPSRGEAMRRHFPDSLHVVAPGGGHNVSFSGCIPQLIADFVEHGTWHALDASCAGKIVRPPFVTSLAGGLP
jgi:pimeloyl-ACP methyl ester carboxylesterase